MKKFLYLSLFLFSFVFLGINFVSAFELPLANLGYSSCLDSEDNIVYKCILDHGDVIYSSNSNSRVSNYFMVSDEFELYSIPSSGWTSICYYDKDYVYITCNSIQVTSDGNSFNKPSNSVFARLNINLSRITYVSDDLNSFSSFDYAINSLSHTVSQTLTIITTNTILLIATAIFVICICLYLIWRIVRGG